MPYINPENELEPSLYEAFESIDAAFFSGDAFHNHKAAACAQYYIGRWQRSLKADEELRNTFKYQRESGREAIKDGKLSEKAVKAAKFYIRSIKNEDLRAGGGPVQNQSLLLANRRNDVLDKWGPEVYAELVGAHVLPPEAQP